MNNTTKIIGAWVASVMMISSAGAAGFSILEQGTGNTGTALAGSVVNANNDASAAYWNASQAVFIPMEEGQTMVTSALTGILPTLGLVDKSSGKSYDCAEAIAVPNLYVVHKFTEDLAGTLSVTAPFGLESKYDSDWIGAAQGVNSFMMTIDINPGFSYKVNEWLSIGGGISAQYVYCKLTSMVMGNDINLRAHGWGIGGNAGFTIKYAEDGRIGFQWRSSVTQDTDGTYRLNGQVKGPITASVVLPDTFTVGIYQRLRGSFNEFAVMADYSYTRWSTFEELAVKGNYPPFLPYTDEEEWKDTSRVSVGMHYYPDWMKDLTLRCGVAFDEAPIVSPQMRTVRIPDSDRVWFSFGAGYQLTESIKLDMGYTYIMTVGNSDIDRAGANPMLPTIQGHYYGHIHLISAQVTFVF